MPPDISQTQFPQWLGWVLTAIVIPSGAYLSKQFIEFMKFQQSRADESSRLFREYLERKDAEAGKERAEWRSSVNALAIQVEKVSVTMERVMDKADRICKAG
jgi:hypothetical protein